MESGSHSKEFENEALLAGFRCGRLPEFRDCELETDVQMGSKVLMGSEFVAWDEFDIFASKLESEVSEALKRQGCHPSNERADRCFGAFQRWCCGDEGCQHISAYKHDIQEYDESDVLWLWLCIKQLLKGLINLAPKLRPSWGAGELTASLVPITQGIGYLRGISHPGRSCPDIIIEAKNPIVSPLLPPVGECNSLASAYNQSCERIRTDSELSYDQNCMAKAIKSAFHTRSGYGCLLNHNQAVFLKVVPDIRQIKAHGRVIHKVWISREFNCEKEISVFHGLLALMLHGKEESNDSTENLLRGYFRLVEASEACVRGGVLIEHRRQEKKRLVCERNWDDDKLSESRKREWSRNSEHVSGYTESAHTGPSRFGEHGGGSEDELDIDWESLYPKASPVAQEKVRRAVKGREFALLSEIDMIRTFMTHSRFVEVGGSGIVFDVTVEGMKVAVKRWNRDNYSQVPGLAWLLTEILVCKMLAKEHPEMLGSVVPRLIAVCEDRMKESVLVTEFVGSRLYPIFLEDDRRQNEAEDGKQEAGWYVSGVKLTEADKKEIEESASAGLRELRRCGISHMEPDSRNLRVQKVTKEGGTTSWRTWWIDLGYVRVRGGEKLGDLTTINSLNEYMGFEDVLCYDPTWYEHKPLFVLPDEVYF